MFQKNKCHCCKMKSDNENNAFKAGIFLSVIVAVITHFYDIWQFC